MAVNSSLSNTDSSTGPTLGVVIVSYNTRALLEACLDALHVDLEVAGLDQRCDVWVVDNASADGSADLVRQRYPWVRLEPLADNRGFTAANNLALRHWLAAGDGGPAWLLLLNPDTAVRPGAIATLIAALEAAPDAAMAGPALVYPNGDFQHAAFHFPGVVQTWLDLVPIARLADSRFNGRYPRARYSAGQPFDVDFVLGACMLLRRTAVQRVGPLDERYFMYCEEIDWCRRLRAAGWRTLCVPGATVLHHGGASTAQFQAFSFVQLWRSRRRYFAQHGGPVQRALVGAALRVGLALRAARDRHAARTGTLSAEECTRRVTAYRQVLADPGRP
jgi:hypothetical protein